MSVASATSTSFDSDLTDADFNPMYDLLVIVGAVAEDITDWYSETTDIVDTGTDWENWFSENISGDNSYGDAPYADRVDFVDWLETLSFNADKTYVSVSGISSKYKASEVLELLSVKVNTLSTNAAQVLVFTEALINNYTEAAEQMRDMIDDLRSAGRGHVEH